jgi:hypothetical protein
MTGDNPMTDQNPDVVWESPMGLDERSRPPRRGNLDGLRYRTGELYDDHGITILIAEATPETFWLRLVSVGELDIWRPFVVVSGYTHACYFMNGISEGAQLEAAKHAHHAHTRKDTAEDDEA